MTVTAPTVTNSEKKRHVFTQLSDASTDELDQRAREVGLSRSAYIRALILRDLGLSAEPGYARRNR